MTPPRCLPALLLVSAALLAAGQTAAAPPQTLWRCGPDGRSFSDRPCADGAPLALDARPSAAAVAEAHAVAARERAALRRLAQERRQRHADAARDGLAPSGIRPTAAVDRDPRDDGTRSAGRPTRRYTVRVPG